jgi:putative endonuclease
VNIGGEKSPAVYILASQLNGTLYIGVTSHLFSRMRAHRTGTFEGFTKKYNVKHLVYYEIHDTMDDAIKRESQLKKWRRLWKIRLIEEMNPTWADLFNEREGIRALGEGGQTGRDFDVG